MEMTVTMAPEIRAMLSPEGERVEVLKVKATGNVEDWLKQVEKNMLTAVRTCIKKAKDDFEKSIREEWLVRHPHQVIKSIFYPAWRWCPFGRENRREKKRIPRFQDPIGSHWISGSTGICFFPHCGIHRDPGISGSAFFP